MFESLRPDHLFLSKIRHLSHFLKVAFLCLRKTCAKLSRNTADIQVCLDLRPDHVRMVSLVAALHTSFNDSPIFTGWAFSCVGIFSGHHPRPPCGWDAIDHSVSERGPDLFEPNLVEVESGLGELALRQDLGLVDLPITPLRQTKSSSRQQAAPHRRPTLRAELRTMLGKRSTGRFSRAPQFQACHCAARSDHSEIRQLPQLP